MISLALPASGETRALGAAIAGLLAPGDVVLLIGELGAGKTTLVKGLVAALGGEVEVTSPTFTLCHLYEASVPIAHVDCWRLSDLDEVLDLGLEEILEERAVVIEWGGLAAARFGSEALWVELAVSGPEGASRQATLSAHGPSWERRAVALEAALGAAGMRAVAS